MKLTKEFAEFLCDCEYVVGENCHQEFNPITYSYLDYRYPVRIMMSKCEDKLLETNKNMKRLKGVAPEKIQDAFYQMGTNQIYIGNALCRIMNMIETRYDLDFNALEEKKKRTTPERIVVMKKAKKRKQTFSYLITRKQVQAVVRKVDQGMREIKSLNMLLKEVLPEQFEVEAEDVMELLGGSKHYKSLLRGFLREGRNSVFLKIVCTCEYENNLYGEHVRECVLNSVTIR